MTTPAAISVLTPPGTGGVATLLVRAPISLLAESQFFQPSGKANLTTLEIGRIVYGRWGQEDIVLCRTDEAHFELHCHGGPAPQKRIIDDLTTLGIVVSTGWEMLATQSGKDLSWDQLLAAVSTESQAMFVLQQRDNQSRLTQSINEHLAIGQPDAAEKLIQDSLDWFDYGQRRLRPSRVVLAGPPNVGKSSLINALIGYERSVVHEQAGTTRDVVTSVVSILGHPVELLDTAGLRDADNEIEIEGVSRTRQQLGRADLILILIDATNPDWTTAREIKSLFPSSLIIINKIDAIKTPINDELPIDVQISARSRTGLQDLQQLIVSALFADHPAPHQFVPLTETQKLLLIGTRQKIGKNS